MNKSIVDIHFALCQKGVTHILINDLGLEVFRTMETSYSPEHWDALADFRRSHLDLVSDIGGSYSLYSVDCTAGEFND